MQKLLAETPAEGAKPAPNPGWLRQVREGALLCVVQSLDPAAWLPADLHDPVGAELSALTAAGTSSERARKLLDRLKAGREFQVIPGGGETVETLRAVLSLVGAK